MKGPSQTTLGFERPYGESFARALVTAARSVFKAGFSPVLAYVFSDEVSYVFIGEESFSRRPEKITSVIASTLSGAFTLELTKLGKVTIAAFDARSSRYATRRYRFTSREGMRTA